MAATCKMTYLKSTESLLADIEHYIKTISSSKNILEEYFNETISSSEQLKLLDNDFLFKEFNIKELSGPDNCNSFVFYLPNSHLFLFNKAGFSGQSCSRKFSDKIPENSRLSILLLKLTADASLIGNKRTTLKLQQKKDNVLKFFNTFICQTPEDTQALLTSADPNYFNALTKNIFSSIPRATDYLSLIELINFLQEINTPDRDYNIVFQHGL